MSTKPDQVHSNGWDNLMANHCPALFEEVGLHEIRSSAHDETSVTTDVDFDEKTNLWIEVIDNLGPTLLSAQACEASVLKAARGSYDAWRKTGLLQHTLSMMTTVGRVP